MEYPQLPHDFVGRQVDDDDLRAVGHIKALGGAIHGQVIECTRTANGDLAHFRVGVSAARTRPCGSPRATNNDRQGHKRVANAFFILPLTERHNARLFEWSIRLPEGLWSECAILLVIGSGAVALAQEPVPSPLTLDAAFDRALNANPTIAAARRRRAVDLAGIGVASRAAES